ncbi:MAG: DUF5906 domain-containing protein [Flavobacteriales bacterium]|nr:MAG: DUF5906 domain-containing protein [Flavobacteriales bacterium]
MIDKRSIDDLLAMVRLDEVANHLGHGLTVKRGYARGNCPVCNGADKKTKEPFSINMKEGYWKCFKCDFKGNRAVKYLHATKGLEWLDAIKWLADFYKVELAQATPGAESGDTEAHAYFHQRMGELGYDPAKPEEKGLFRPRSDGGIDIHYPALQAGAWQEVDGKPFVRTRLHPTRCTPSQKYSQSSGSGIHIFIPPVVVADYLAGVEWPAIAVVEGEFKAYAAAEPGRPVVGIGGIDLYNAAKGDRTLHPDLEALLSRAKCVHLVHDADAMQVKWDPVAEPDKDLGKRLRKFAGAVTGFRRAVGTLVPRVCYRTIRSPWIATAKGLDDLLRVEDRAAVLDHLWDAQRANSHFDLYDLTDADWQEVNRIFRIKLSYNVPTDFYDKYQALIGQREFRFLGGRYQYREKFDVKSGATVMGLEQLEHPDSKRFVAVGTDWYKRCYRLDENNKPVPYLEHWSESRLKLDYVRRGVPKFLETVEHFDGFTNHPGHHEDYKATVIVQPEEFGPVTKLYNRYAQLTHPVRKGGIPNIQRYLKHVFGTHKVFTLAADGTVLAESEAWEVYMDRWTIMYRMPWVKLPAVVLVSEEFNTGKSTLLWLNLAMWQQNAVVIGGEAFTSNFNAHWVDKKYVGVDEALIHKREDTEKVKSLITAPTTQRRGMYKDSEAATNFTTFDLTSNNEDGSINIGENEYRYWVVRVPKLSDAEKDPELLSKMIAELPALFYELRHRAIIHPNRDRLWFADSVLETEARQRVAAASVPYPQRMIAEFVNDAMYEHQWPELIFTRKQITEGVNKVASQRIGLHEVGKHLRMMKHVGFFKGWARKPRTYAQRKESGILADEPLSQEWWVFRAHDFVGAELAEKWREDAAAEWVNNAKNADILGKRSAEGTLPVYFKSQERYQARQPVEA